MSSTTLKVTLDLYSMTNSTTTTQLISQTGSQPWAKVCLSRPLYSLARPSTFELLFLTFFN